MAKKAIKVLHINCNYLTTALHQTMMEHLDGLARAPESIVFAPTYAAKNAIVKPRQNVVVSECFRKTDRFFFHYKQHKIRRALEKSVRVQDFDCIHAYTLFTDGNCARALSEKYGIPYVVAVRSTDVNVFLKKMVHLRGLGVEILRGAAAVFFLSENYRQQVLRKYVPEQFRQEIMDKSQIIGNGIDEFWHENTQLPDIEERSRRIGEKRLKVVYAGRVNRNKNPLTTALALRVLRERGWEADFTIAGNVEDEAVYEKLRAEECLTCLPKLPKERLIEVYRANDIFIMPSHKETFGLVYAEALSQGLPILYTRGQGFDGQIPEGSAGFAVDADSPEDIADKVEQIAQNYGKMCEAAMRMAGRFQWDDICKKYVDIYENM